MTRPRLGGVPREEVTLLVREDGPPGPLGDRAATWHPGATYTATVTPLSAEQATRAGLIGSAARLRVGLPADVVVAPRDRLRLRGQDWEAVSVSLYASYTRVIVEGG